jgi:molecular chaperone GrpE
VTATPERGGGRPTGQWPKTGSGNGFDREPGDREPTGPVIRDRRRIDPLTGAVREPREAAAPAATPADTVESLAARVVELESSLAERTADLQRLQAEYLNYKRRVDRDRDFVRDSAVASALGQLLPVLDDIDRARDHGELEGGFKAVAESFERIVTSLGLERFGEVGDPFDPHVHEALMHSYSPDVDAPTAQMVVQPGYRFRDRVVRPARVAVVEPVSEVAAEESHTESDQAGAADSAQPTDEPEAPKDTAAGGSADEPTS